MERITGDVWFLDWEDTEGLQWSERTRKTMNIALQGHARVESAKQSGMGRQGVLILNGSWSDRRLLAFCSSHGFEVIVAHRDGRAVWGPSAGQSLRQE